MSLLAHRIRRARLSAAQTQMQLAGLIDVNRSAVAQWERKGGSRPTSENLAKIAIATKVNFDWLATGRGKSHGPEHVHTETSALELRYFAHNDLEERLLLGFRTLPPQKQAALLELMEPHRE